MLPELKETNLKDQIFNTVQEAIDAVKAGEIVIVADDEDRENEGDLVVAAEKITPEAVNFMSKEGRGLICLALDEEIANKLDLREMTNKNTSNFGTAFTVTIDAHTRFGVTTGISAHDRAKTIQIAISENAKPNDLVSPGHIFPLVAKRGGVLKRVGQTEASVDLAPLSSLNPSHLIL